MSSSIESGGMVNIEAEKSEREKMADLALNYEEYVKKIKTPDEYDDFVTKLNSFSEDIVKKVNTGDVILPKEYAAYAYLNLDIKPGKSSELKSYLFDSGGEEEKFNWLVEKGKEKLEKFKLAQRD